MRAVFLDRDGTIVADYPDEGWRGRRQPEFLPGAIAALRELRRLGFELIVVTNQYLIGEGLITLADYRAFTQQMVNQLEAGGVTLLDIFFCPHPRSQACSCRKPGRELIDQALGRYPRVRLADSLLVGDTSSDMQLAARIGVRGFLLQPGRAEPTVPNVTVVDTLTDVAHLLANNGSGP